MKRPKSFKKRISFGIASFFLLALALMFSINAHSEAATATFDREIYCPPSGNSSTDFERAWISVTDTTATTNTLSVVVKNITSGVTANYLLSRGTTTAGTIPFTTSGTSTQATSTGVGSTFGYVEDYNGLHNFPGLGSSVKGLKLNVGVISSPGDATAGTEGVLDVTEGSVIQVLIGGSPIGSATVKYYGSDDSSITFTTANWGNTIASGQNITSATDNFVITLADPNENLNPVMKDAIGFKDGVVLGAGDSVNGTGTSRVQIEAIDPATGSRLTGAISSGIILVETGVNTGTFEARGKVYGSTEVSAYGNLRVGTATGTNVVSLGSQSTPPYASMRIIEANSNGKLGLFYSGTLTASTGVVANIGFASGDSSTFSTFSIGASNWAVALGTSSTAFGTSTVVNVGTSTYQLHKLIDGANYCTVILDAYIGTTTTSPSGNIWSDSTGSKTVTLDSFILAGPRQNDSIKASYFDEISAKYSSNAGTITSTTIFGATGVSGNLSVSSTTADINDLLSITVADSNLNVAPGEAENINASTWAGTTTNSKSDLFKIVDFIANSPSTAGSAVSGMGSYTVFVSNLDNSSVGTQAVRISNSDNTYVWIVPNITSAHKDVRFGVTGTYSAFSLGTLTTSKVALVRGNSANATTLLNSATKDTFVATADAVNNTVEVSPDGTRWIAVPMSETGANSGTFVGTIGFDCTAARLTTDTSKKATDLITSYTGTSTIKFESPNPSDLNSVIGTGSVVRISDGSYSDIREVLSVGTSSVVVTKLTDAVATQVTPWKTFVQVLGNDMDTGRLSNNIFRIGGYFKATYRVRYNDALAAGNVYAGGDTALQTSSFGFTTYGGTLSISPSGTIATNGTVVVTVVDSDLNTSATTVQSTYAAGGSTNNNEIGLGYPGTQTSNTNSSVVNGFIAKQLLVSRISSVTNTDFAKSDNTVSVLLQETGVNTGTFLGTFKLRSDGSTANSATGVSELKVSNGDTITVFYNDSPSDTQENLLSSYMTTNFVAQSKTSTFELSKSEAFLSGDTIVATIVDDDMNLNSSSIDTFGATSTVYANSNSDSTNMYVLMTETAVNSATFKGTVKTGTTGANSGTAPTIRSVANGTITVVYSETSPARDLTKTVSTKNFGATVAFNESAVALNGYAGVTLSDKESNKSIADKDTASVTIKSTTDSTGTTLSLTETGVDTGSFAGSIQVSTGASIVNTNIKVVAGDTVTASFTDNPDADGNSSTKSATTLVGAPLPTPSPTPTVTATVTPTATVSPTVTPTATVSPTVTPTPAATGIITGVVVSTTSIPPGPIAGATVSTNTGGYSATTGADGSFSITGVAAGTYTLTATATGYTSASQSVTVTGGATETVTFDLVAAVPTPTQSPTPTVSPVASPTPTATPTVCTATTITLDPTKLTLKRKESGDVAVTVTGANGCAVEGQTVTVKIDKAGSKRVKVSSASGTTDANGQVTFTFKAKNTTGNAKVTFKAGTKSKKMTIKVRK